MLFIGQALPRQIYSPVKRAIPFTVLCIAGTFVGMIMSLYYV